jgi:hypothetical protein
MLMMSLLPTFSAKADPVFHSAYLLEVERQSYMKQNIRLNDLAGRALTGT